MDNKILLFTCCLFIFSCSKKSNLDLRDYKPICSSKYNCIPNMSDAEVSFLEQYKELNRKKERRSDYMLEIERNDNFIIYLYGVAQENLTLILELNRLDTSITEIQKIEGKLNGFLNNKRHYLFIQDTLNNENYTIGYKWIDKQFTIDNLYSFYCGFPISKKNTNYTTKYYSQVEWTLVHPIYGNNILKSLDDNASLKEKLIEQYEEELIDNHYLILDKNSFLLLMGYNVLGGTQANFITIINQNTMDEVISMSGELIGFSKEKDRYNFLVHHYSYEYGDCTVSYHLQNQLIVMDKVYSINCGNLIPQDNYQIVFNDLKEQFIY